MGGGRGFYGREIGVLGKSHRRFFKKPPVEILKTTGDFFENHRWFYLAGPGIVPKKGWKRTFGIGGGDQIEGVRLTSSLTKSFGSRLRLLREGQALL